MYDNHPAAPRRTMADVLPIFGTFAGIQNLGGEERIQTSVHMTYIGLLGNPAVTD